MQENLSKLQNKIISCRQCPRLVSYIKTIRDKYPNYWCKPVPSFGDPNGKILIVGLAPGRFGSNRTGRMFTGDSSGNFMYKILYEVGLCNKPDSVDLNDGLVLKNCYITAVGRCAPPQNKPTPKELDNCFPYFASEIDILKKVRVVIALGKIAFDGYFKWLGMRSETSDLRKKDFVFSHNAAYKSDKLPHVLIASYHPSRQNTQTGKLTPKMFRQVFEKAIRYADAIE